MRIAVAGKGGSGKSLVAGMLARLLARRGEKVLALDSDPIPGLALSLGMGPLTDAMLQDAVERDGNGRWRLKKGLGAARAVQRYARVGPDGVRLLQFGKASAEGMTPVMGSLNAFYQVTHRLARDDVLRGWSIVGDLPAGPRQAAFGWAPYASTFVVVTEPTWKSVLTARRVIRIATARAGVRAVVVASKVTDVRDVSFVEARLGRPVAVSIPLDDAVRTAEIEGVSLLDHSPGCPAAGAIENMLDLLTSETRGRTAAS